MGKLKNLLYDTSDILAAACIVGIASVVIWFSIGNIMEYPSIVAAESQKNQQNENFGLAVPVVDETSDSAIGTDNGNVTTPSGADIEVYSIYINYGESISAIAQKFVSVGLFDSVEQFNTLIAEKNAAASIKAGNFIIPADTTPEEVITQITTTPGL